MSGVVYQARWGATLAPGGWTLIADTGTGNTHTFNLPAVSEPHRFVRYLLTIP